MATVIGSPSAGVVVTIDQAAVARMLGSPTGMTGRWLLGKANEVRNLAVGFCPVDQGRLITSIEVDGVFSGGPDSVWATVGSNVEYAWYVHEGRGPVYPKNKKVLRWIAPGGEVVFAKRAGPAAGQPFLQRAVDQAL